MSDHERRLADIEKRLARLEEERFAPWKKHVEYKDGVKHTVWSQRPQFCPCGRDVCRAPDCPSHNSTAVR